MIMIPKRMLILLALSVPLRLIAQPSVSLTLEPSRIEAGTPATFRLLVKNGGDQDLKLPEKLLLRVVPSNGAPFIGEWGASQEHRFSHAELPTTDRTVTAHSTREFAFRAYAIDRSVGWFWDPRLNTPGTYRLQVLFVDPFREEKVFHTAPFDLDAKLPVRVASDEAVLVIETPRGEDASLWAELLASAKQHGYTMWSPLFRPDRDFVNDVIENHPESAYAPFLVGNYVERSSGERFTPEERLMRTQRVLELHPDSQAREQIEILIAELEVSAAQHAASAAHPDVERAIQFYEKARSAFSAIERTSTDDVIRNRSREERERLPAAEDLRHKDDSSGVER